MKRLLIVLLSLMAFSGYSQMVPALKTPKILDPSKWKVSYSKSEVKIGDRVDVILTVDIEENWYLYSIGDNPPHATISFLEHPSYSLVGKVQEGPGVKEKHDDDLDMDVKYYEKKAVFRQTVKILKANPVISIEVSGQVCSRVNGQCVLVNKDLTTGKIKLLGSLNEIKKPDTIKSEQPTPIKTTKENSSSEKVAKLEEEKAKLVTKDSKGKDESVEYLKNFATKYGRKK